MSEIQRRGGPQVEALLRRFGVKNVPPGFEVIDTVLPVAEVTRLDNLCGGGIEIAGLAANRSIVQLFNPRGSGVILILHRVWVSLEVAGVTGLRTHDTPLATLVTSVGVLNRTRGNQPQPSGEIRSAQSGSVGADVIPWRVAVADETIEIPLGRLGGDQSFVGPSLAEGRGFAMVPSADDVRAGVSFLWSERITE